MFSPKIRYLLMLSFICSVFISGCADAPVGSKKRPFAMYFIPSVDSEQILATSSKVTAYISRYVSQKLYHKDVGFYVKGAVPSSYIAVVEALGTKKADFAALTTFSYVLAKDIKKYDVEAAVTVLRGNNEHSYKAQFIARSDSGIKNLKDLKGKKFAYTDPASTSGFILPAKMLKDLNIPLAETVFAQKHDSVVTMVYQKQVDAGATYYSPPQISSANGKTTSEIKDARARVLTQFPDVEEKIKIIGFTQDIPNEPWVLRSKLVKDQLQNESMKAAIIEALLSYSHTSDGKEMLQVLSTGTGLIRVSDPEYDEIRKIVLEAQINLEDVIAQQKS